MTDRPRRRRSKGTRRPPPQRTARPRPEAFPVLEHADTEREVVYQCLAESRNTARFATEILQTRLPASLQDRHGFCLELLSGIVRRQRTLDVLIEHQTGRHRSRIEAPLRAVLWIGAYQLYFMDSIPDHAAIHETVELAKRLNAKRWAGFTNGVLRGLSRLNQHTVALNPASHHLPLRDGTYRVLSADVFPCPQSELCDYFTDAFSFPPWLTQRWTMRWPEDVLFNNGFWFNGPGRQFLRVNTLLTTRADLLERLRVHNIAMEEGALPESLVVISGGHVTAVPEFTTGHFSIQDESAMHAVDLLDPQPGERILDLCAAPGTKTTHLAERMGNQGRILATDISARRLPAIDENCRRLGIDIIEPRAIASIADLDEPPFDGVLVDVPCSNTGVLGKRPESRWRQSAEELADLTRMQKALLRGALERVNHGGRLVYSTCSIEPDENGEMVRSVLKQTSGYELEREQHHEPGKPADGAYQARIRRRPKSRPAPGFRSTAGENK